MNPELYKCGGGGDGAAVNFVMYKRDWRRRRRCSGGLCDVQAGLQRSCLVQVLVWSVLAELKFVMLFLLLFVVAFGLTAGIVLPVCGRAQGPRAGNERRS